MRNKNQTCRVAMLSLLCLIASFALLTTAADAKSKSKTKGNVCKGVKWSYNASSKTLTISGKGYAKIDSFRKKGEYYWLDEEDTRRPVYRWPASGDRTLPAFKKIVFKEGITKIDYAYFTMEGINSISLPKSLKSIAYSASYEVNGKYEPYSTTLKKITVNKKNKKFSASNGVLYSKNKKTLYAYPAGKSAERYTISKKVTKIARDAFYGSDIQTVKLPANLTYIGEKAFLQSTITKLQMNKKLKKINHLAFYGTDLTSVSFPETLITIDEGAFQGCPLTQVILPKNVTKIGTSAFASNKKLTNIVINCNCDLGNVFTNCSKYYEKYDGSSDDLKNQQISVTLGKGMTAPVSDLITDLGTRIKFTVAAGNTKYYIKDGSLYVKRGNKLQYTPQKPEQPTQTPEAPSPSPAA